MLSSSVVSIELQPSVCQQLQRLLGANVQLAQYSADEVDRKRLGKSSLLLIGSVSDDPCVTISLIRRCREVCPQAPIVLIAWASSEILAIAALRERVSEYFPPPVDLLR